MIDKEILEILQRKEDLLFEIRYSLIRIKDICDLLFPINSSVQHILEEDIEFLLYKVINLLEETRVKKLTIKQKLYNQGEKIDCS